jgi:hypothetical protein
MAVCQNLVPLVNIKIAGKWMFIPLKMVLIGIDPYPYSYGESLDGLIMRYVTNLVNIQKTNWKIAIEIVDLPIDSMGILTIVMLEIFGNGW